MSNPKYKVTFYMKKRSGEVVPWEDLTDEEIEEFRENGTKRLQEWGNRYFAQHPDIYETLPLAES